MSIARIFITSGEKVRREATQAARSGSESCIKSEGDRRWFTGADALVVWHSVCGGRWGRGRGRGERDLASRPAESSGPLFVLAGSRPTWFRVCVFSLSLSLSRSPPLFFPRISLRARFISDRRSARKSIFQHGRETCAERSSSRDSPTRHRKQTRAKKFDAGGKVYSEYAYI